MIVLIEHNGKLLAALLFFVGFIAQMFQLPTSVSFLHKSFKLALLPQKNAMNAQQYVMQIYFFQVFQVILCNIHQLSDILMMEKLQDFDDKQDFLLLLSI